MVIYNVSKHSAIDFINGSQYRFVGDSILKEEGLLQNFHLKPARISMQAAVAVAELTGLKNDGNYWQFYNRKILVIDSAMIFEPKLTPVAIDVLLVTKNAKVRIADLVLAVKPAIVVFDASNNLWKIADWKKECEELLLRSHTVIEKGAFVLDVSQ
jgi:competence protein ComEC